MALEAIYDPGNLGTIIRLCDWFGVSQLVCSTDTVDCYNSKVVQASMGSLARTSIVYTDLKNYLSNAEIPIYGAVMNGKNVNDTELEKNGINLNDYEFVAVRNDTDILKEVLRQRATHNYKVAFRLSFPKRIAKLQTDEANHKKSFLDVINNKIKTYSETNLINECDIFLPTSRQMRDDYLKDVKTRTFVIPSAIDPEVLQHNIQHEGNEKRFFYAGTLDKLREFETVLDAFNDIHSDKFKIMISSKDPEYTSTMISKFPNSQTDLGQFPVPQVEEALFVALL